MPYLETTYFLDFDHASVQKFIAEFDTDTLSDEEKAIGIYNKVRDTWKYNPYHISFEKDAYKASHILQKDSGNCVEKSVILVAALRGLGLPARLHLGKVKNHITVERLTEKFGSNELSPHGMVNVYLAGKWLKMSPAFNASLCKMLNVEPLEFDGKNDSYLQQYDSAGSRFMEYTDDYGHFDDVPVDFLVANIKAHYPHIFDTGDGRTEFFL